MLLNFRFTIVFFLFLTFFNTQNGYSKDFIIKDSIEPYCDGKESDLFLKETEIKNIEIVTNNTRKWVKNALRVLKEFNSEDSKTHNTQWFNFRIKDKYKKNFKSNVFVNFNENKLSCRFKARIRITGDLWWHLDWKKGTPLTSIQVKLLEGHINNITTFKLLLPKSREGGENEIFITSFLKELGFLAPRTFMVSAKINGVNVDYIFQEDLRKEFLENLKLNEGPLLEGDERMTVDKIKDDQMIPELSLSRIINKNFALKGKTNQKTALSAVSNLNLIYLQHHQVKTSSNLRYLPYDKLHINTEKFFLDNSNKGEFQIYEALIYALDAYHSLSFDDRRFYYDPVKQFFLPIYYDGKSKIVNDTQKSEIQLLTNTVSIDAKKGAQKAIGLINKLNHVEYKKKLLNYGINISDKKYKNLIQKILTRLEVINLSNPPPVKFLETQRYFSEMKKNIEKNRKLIFVNLKNEEFYLCSFDLNDCETTKGSDLTFNNSLANILSQKFPKLDKDRQIDNEYLFVYNDLNYEKGEYNGDNIWKYHRINEDFVIKHNTEVEVSIHDQKKEIIIKQLVNSGRAVITGKVIDGWQIIFDGTQSEINSNISKDHLNLTGCLTLLDIQVKNVNLFSKNSTCEDSINFIRVNGDLQTVSILESNFDAFDLDFSNIKINFLTIKSAKNDCLDLSHGKYTINNIIAENCGDKAISIGEKSDTLLKEIKINRSNIAVAVKDSSFAKVESANISNSPICFSAYRKKQEFSGGKIQILKTNCKNEQFYSQKGSSIILGL